MKEFPEKNFKHFGFFMLRTSTLKYSTYEEINKNLHKNFELKEIFKVLDEKNQKDFVSEALFISSSNLSASINEYENRNQKQKRQIINSYLNYLNRMSSRATPFGLMASVGYGEFSDSKETSNYNKYLKDLAIDSEWIGKFIGINTMNSGILNKMKIKVNPTIFLKDNRLRIDVQSPFITTSSVVLPNDKFLNYIFLNTKELISTNLLVEKIKKEFPYINDDSIKLSLLKLIKHGFFVNDFSANSNKGNIVNSLIENKSNTIIMEKEAKLIQNYIKEYQSEAPGKGLENLRKLSDELNNKILVKNPLQVNLFNKEKGTLETSIGDEITEVADVLYQLSKGDDTLAYMEQYRRSFLQKFGYEKEIPLKLLLDEDKGLGDPYIHNNPKLNKSSRNNMILLDLLQETIANNLDELVLTEEMIKEISTPKTKKNTQNSLELYFELIKYSSIAKGEKNYSIILGPNVGTRGAGKTFARFDDFFNKDTGRKASNMLRDIEKRTSTNILYAEVLYIPEVGKSLNLLPGNSKYSYHIDINTGINDLGKTNLNLDDLVVGIEKNSFYLKSKTLKKQVIPIKNHMINHRAFPKIARFLCDLEYEGQNNWAPFDWGELENKKFLPRVRFKNTIIFSARWLFNTTLIKDLSTLEFRGFLDFFKQWKQDNKVPRYIYIGTTSTRLMYNLDFSNDVEKIYNIIKNSKKNQTLVFVEANQNFKTEKSSPYSQEVVVPLYSSHEYKAIPSHEKLQRKLDPDVEFLPGSVWTSFKIYTSKESQEEILSKVVWSVTQELELNNEIEKWYFLRFTDPNPHIRFRVKSNLNKQSSRVIDNVFRKLTNDLDASINDLVIDTYRPEISKYGGIELIDVAESWFNSDSKSIIEFSRYSNTNISISKINYTVLSLYDLIDNFAISKEIMITWIDSLINYRTHVKEFRERKKSLISYFNDCGNLDYDSLPNDFNLSFVQRNTTLKRYKESILEKEFFQDPTFIQYSVFKEIIHMHINRIFGTSKELELRVLGILRHLIKSLQNKRLYK